MQPQPTTFPLACTASVAYGTAQFSLSFVEESYRRMSGINGFHMLEKQLERVERLIRENHINCYLKFGFRTYEDILR